MALSDSSKILISIKKLVGKAHTSNDKDVANEGLPSGLTLASNTIFAQTIPVHTGATAKYEILSNSLGEGVVEFLRFSASFIAGTDTASGRHGFQLKLPDDYQTNSKNPKKGVYPYLDQQSVYITSGSLQLVPPSFDSDYEGKPYHTSGGETRVPVLDARDWSLDYFNGIFFQQDPPGTGDHAENPSYIDGYLYIGEFSDKGVFSSGMSGSLTKLTDGTSYLAAGTNVTISSASNGQIIISSDNDDSTFPVFITSPSNGNMNATGSLSLAGTLGTSHTVTSIGTDVFFFVSGSTESKGTTTRGAAVFGGDVVISGTLGGGSPLEIDSKIIVNAGRINSQEYDFIVFGADHAGREIITTHIPNNMVLLLSGGGATSPNEFNYTDTAFFVSGSIGSRGTATRGASIFGGDVITSGTVTSLSGLSGSLTRLKDGVSYLAAGGDITISSASNGQVTIASNAQVQRKKYIYEVTSSHASNNILPVASFDFANVNYSSDRIDLYVNGQLMMSGTTNDYLISINDTGAKFTFDLESGDIIAIRTF